MIARFTPCEVVEGYFVSPSDQFFGRHYVVRAADGSIRDPGIDIMRLLAREVEELRQFPEEQFAYRCSTTIPATGSTVHETDEELQGKKLLEEHFRLLGNNPDAFWEGKTRGFSESTSLLVAASSSFRP